MARSPLKGPLGGGFPAGPVRPAAVPKGKAPPPAKPAAPVKAPKVPKGTTTLPESPEPAPYKRGGMVKGRGC